VREQGDHRLVAIQAHGDPFHRADGRPGAEQLAAGRQKVGQTSPPIRFALGGDAEGLERAAHIPKPVVQGQLEVRLLGDLVGVGDDRQGGGVGDKVGPEPGGEADSVSGAWPTDCWRKLLKAAPNSRADGVDGGSAMVIGTIGSLAGAASIAGAKRNYLYMCPSRQRCPDGQRCLILAKRQVGDAWQATPKGHRIVP